MKYSIAVLTSMGARLCPPEGRSFSNTDSFIFTITSAETNAASVASYLGEPVKVLTAFVEGSPISAAIKANLRSRGMEYEGRDYPAGGPWGMRHQFNLADSGFAARGPRVFNDRAGEVGRGMTASDFDLDRLFDRDGVKILHISGLIAALSPETSALCVTLAQRARAAGGMVSFDLNYRASFWAGREAELRKSFEEIAKVSDILIGNEEDFQLCLEFGGPEAGGKALGDKIDAFSVLAEEVMQRYPQARLTATTLREVIDANRHSWGAVLRTRSETFIETPREIGVYDRIGGGDGFVGGLLYGVLRDWKPEKCLAFGWACGALAVTGITDYAIPEDEEQVWNIYRGNARVQR